MYIIHVWQVKIKYNKCKNISHLTREEGNL